MRNSLRRLVGSAAIALALSQSGAASRAEEPVAKKITFFVYYRSGKDVTVGRPNVEVSRIGPEGATSLGSTDAAGELALAAVDVFRPHSVALLFCDPQFKELCSAIRVDSKFLQGFEEFNVQLPLFQLVDRMRITPR